MKIDIGDMEVFDECDEAWQTVLSCDYMNIYIDVELYRFEDTACCACMI